MYLLARAWGLSPDQFWSMTMCEWFCEFEQHQEREERKPSRPGHLNQGEIERLKAIMEADDGTT